MQTKPFMCPQKFLSVHLKHFKPFALICDFRNQLKTPEETFPRFPSIIDVIARSD